MTQVLPTLRIELKSNPDWSDRQAIADPLVDFNEARGGSLASAEDPVAVLIRTQPTDAIIGGLWGRCYYSWMFIELLFVPEHLRGRGIGTRLIDVGEAAAAARGCHGVWLDTFSIQARGFYERLNYTVFGTIEDHPIGHQRFFLKKRLIG